MIYFLIGPDGFKTHTKRALGDRTMDEHGLPIKVYTRGEQLRGTRERIAVIIDDDGEHPKPQDREVMILIDYLNSLVDKAIKEG